MKTVSRVVNNEPHVRPALRERVLRAIGELDYKPNLAARQLAASRSFLISLIMHGTTISYYSEILVAAATECRRLGYHLVPETFDESESGLQVVERVLSQLRPDGMILAPPMCDDPAIVAAVERAGAPLARLAGTGDLYGAIVPVHEREPARLVVEHLIGLGHRRIGLIAPPLFHHAAQARVEGYREALTAAKLPIRPTLIERGDFSFASGVHATERLLGARQRPTAIFAANDGMALGAMAVARRMGFAIPGDLAIAGFDDSSGGRMTFPPLTTVRQPYATLARSAVAAILGGTANLAPLAYDLLCRGSTTGEETMVLDVLDA